MSSPVDSPISESILICCDLDRTLIPNGRHTESAFSRDIFRDLINKGAFQLAYVSGRDKARIFSAIEEYSLPSPNLMISDVGSSIYFRDGENYTIDDNWQTTLSQDWPAAMSNELFNSVSALANITPQEIDKQNRFKLSFYCAPDIANDRTQNEIQQIAKKLGMDINIIISIDEVENIGLIDLLPVKASKYHALDYLTKQYDYSKQQLLFAGDSGNDIPVIISDIKSVLVKNSTLEVKQQVEARRDMNANAGHSYIAQGDFIGLNGYYSAGVIEGIAHYFPHTLELIRKTIISYQ